MPLGAVVDWRGRGGPAKTTDSGPKGMSIDMQPFGCIIASMDNVFKALADQSRRALLDLLHQNNGQTLGDLCQHLDMTRQAVTKHLVLLEAANLVVPLWHGRKKLHYLNPVPLHQITERWVDKYQRRIPLALNELERGLEKIQDGKRSETRLK
jgi:DNA-binding transcriptional ArsR family regulator